MQTHISPKPENTEKNNVPLMERVLFFNRPLLLCVFAAITIFLGYHMLQIRPEASFLRMIPTYHPYIKNYIDHKEDLKSQGNTLRIAVETTKGDIFNKEYLEVLKNINDDVFFVSGVDRASIRSIWMPVVRYSVITVDGVDGGPVMDDSYDGSPESLEQLKKNIFRSGEIGTLVANDFTSCIIHVSLHDIDPETGKPLDYKLLSEKLEAVRATYQSDDIQIHITGFAKVVGDLIDGSTRVLGFFMIAFFVLLGILFYNSRCLRSTAMRAISSLTAVVWQLGIMKLCGYGLNPYSMLVPFLMFALGVSHGIQMFNAMVYEMGKGTDKIMASRIAFRLNYIPGLAALITDCIGFATLMIIRIGVIQDIAIGASIGVAVVAFTDLMLLPLLMSYSGVSEKTVAMLKKRQAGMSHPVWAFLSNFTRKKYATAAILVAVIGLVGGIYVRQDLKTGDLDPGAPELRPDSRYNKDVAYMNAHYSTSSDIFIVLVKTPEEGNADYKAVINVDRLKWQLSHLEGVQDVQTHVDAVKFFQVGYNEGNWRWLGIPRGDKTRAYLNNFVPLKYVNEYDSLSKIIVFLKDHKAETLERVVSAVEVFSEENNTEYCQFLMAAGNAGIEAATNIEVEKALVLLTLVVYAVVFLVCLITYRSFRGAVCVVGPLVITSVLCEALMAKMGIGIKVATLPVIAVGVGIGVDYGIYIYNKLLYYRSQGHDLTTAYYRTLNTTGRAVSFTGITLAIGVATWAFSPIKFQADMGFLLTFMFLWNMVGAMVLLPALARFLLKD